MWSGRLVVRTLDTTVGKELLRNYSVICAIHQGCVVRSRLETPHDLARLVRQARLARHWSQGALAERIGVTRQAVANLESGRTVPSIATALAAVRALGMHVEILTDADHVRDSDTVEVSNSAELTIQHGPVDLDAVLDAVRDDRTR